MPEQNKRTVGIFTNLMDFNPGYSLSGIIVDQCLMLLRGGHRVVLFVNEQYNKKFDAEAGLSSLKDKFGDCQFVVLPNTKFMHLIDYESVSDLTEEHSEDAQQAGEIFADLIKEYSIERCITHDFVFTGWSLPYSLAVKNAGRILANREYPCFWFHWIHSVPSTNRDWWRINEYGANHFLVFPNQTDRQRVIEQFHASPGRVIAIPHIKDIRTWYNFGSKAWQFLDEYPEMLQADIIQIYPASCDRMSAKQVHLVIKLFSFFKRLQPIRVFLVIANQWATGRQRRESVDKYIEFGEECGLEYGKEFVFTSEHSLLGVEGERRLSSCDTMTSLEAASRLAFPADWMDREFYPKFATMPIDKAKEEIILSFRPYQLGVGKRLLRELQLVSNLFIFPTKEESFGLVGPECAFSGALCVSNRSLPMMYEVMSPMAPAFDFGSHQINHSPVEDENYIQAVAHAILGRMNISEAVMTKTHCRIKYNMDSLYHRYYLPNILQ